MTPILIFAAAVAAIGTTSLALAGIAAPFPGARETIIGFARYAAFFLGLALLAALAAGVEALLA